ncbi:hypothetical protein M0804_003769 [Polistes exclamans]|nr:hypothetical protein M0804_003769 [Polistes exclamans]
MGKKGLGNVYKNVWMNKRTSKEYKGEQNRVYSHAGLTEWQIKAGGIRRFYQAILGVTVVVVLTLLVLVVVMLVVVCGTGGGDGGGGGGGVW